MPRSNFAKGVGWCGINGKDQSRIFKDFSKYGGKDVSFDNVNICRRECELEPDCKAFMWNQHPYDGISGSCYIGTKSGYMPDGLEGNVDCYVKVGCQKNLYSYSLNNCACCQDEVYSISQSDEQIYQVGTLCQGETLTVVKPESFIFSER